ncbi:Arginine metabolism regulation protein II [Colletotrichum siamense]|uniref:Arginine metabolism regulation protein II n=1 Tax=Colletotrichum siamense TaxID=690259 RepID=A0A9P5EKC2_COLSI|nr:Arginine metabolism regulation protein II [Colletotrichum siamense]KAF4849916.1 Arginine metabolism regulation protein II [Colletotrichum siamense]
MPTQFYRRSRNGCVTCRAARIKCDEAHPLCKQCERRGVACGGYKVKLKWVEASDVSPGSQASAKSVVKPRSSLAICPSSKTAKAIQYKKLANSSTALIRNPTTGPRLHSSSDVFIFTHWSKSLPDLVYPNPEEYVSVREPYLAFVWQQDSILLPAVLAAGASHLFALGVVTQEEVLERKQRALGQMVACVQQQKRLPPTETQHKLPLYVSEEAIAASLALIGLEIMQGSDTCIIRPLIRGTRAQLEERILLLQAMSDGSQLEKPTPMMSVNIKMLAYMDALCCVPCARKPVFDRQFWQSMVLPHCSTSAKRYPDIVFGYTTDILPLMGDSGALVEDFFSGGITPESFVLSRYCLLQDLNTCCRELPAAVQQPFCEGADSDTLESHRIRTGNACIAAALSFGLATQIFLLRADDGDSSTTWTDQPLKQSLALVEQLSEAVLAVPVDTFASTMMIWPMFVLGCETMPVSSRRHQVELRLEKMLEKNGLLNISVALELLRNRIWKIDGVQQGIKSDEKSPSTTGTRSYSQSDWVRYCWAEKLELCAA